MTGPDDDGSFDCQTVGDLLDALDGVPRDWPIQNDFENHTGYFVTPRPETKEVLFF